MGSKAFLFFGLLFTIVLLIISEVSARDLAETSSKQENGTTEEGATEINSIHDAKYGDGGYVGYHGGGGYNGGGNEGYIGGGHRGNGGGGYNNGGGGGYTNGGHGDKGGYNNGGDRGGNEEYYNGGGGGHGGGRCDYGCCDCYHGGGCKRCCPYAAEASDTKTQAKPQNCS